MNEAQKLIKKQFEDKVNDFCRKVIARQPSAHIQFGREECRHPQDMVTEEVMGMTMKTAFASVDMTITIHGDQGKEKYSAWINDAGQICGCRYIR